MLTDSSEDFPKSLKDENYMLKIILGEQKIALDMIMRKYRQQTDRLTKLSQVDLRKLHYQRYLNTIVNQVNKMNKMSQTMRKNLLVILKYEELMSKMEAENERLHGIITSLSKALEKFKVGVQLKECLEVSIQTDVSAQERKSILSDISICENPLKPISVPETTCTQVVPYVSIGFGIGDYAGKSPKEPSLAELRYDEAYEKILSKFASSDTPGNLFSLEMNTKSSGALVTDLELFEDPSERVTPDFQPKDDDESSEASVNSGHITSNSSESRSIEEVYDDVQ